MTSFDENNIRDFVDLQIKNEKSKLDGMFPQSREILFEINLYDGNYSKKFHVVDDLARIAYLCMSFTFSFAVCSFM